jgi:competence protein ComEC
MPSDFWDSLKNTGTAHVVVASGMNVSLVAGFLVSFFTFFLHRRKALYLALLGVWIYSFMSGLDAPIVRAAIMGSIAFSAQEFGRVNFSVRALFITSFFMIFINPSYLSDRGFWLSISSTLGMIVLGSRINNSLVRLPAGLRESISSSLAAQVGAAPFLFLFFGRFNFLSPLINALVLWTVVPITIIGLLAGLIGGVVPVIGRLMLLLAYPLTFWFVYIVKLFSWDF